MSSLLTGVYLSPSGQLALLEVCKDRKFNIDITWKIPLLNRMFVEESDETQSHFMPYNLVLANNHFLPVDMQDINLLLSSWEFLGPLNFNPVSEYAKRFLRVGSIWTDYDDRLERFVEVIAIGDYFVTIKNIHTGRVTQASKERFNGDYRNYRLSNIQNKKVLLKKKTLKKHSKKKGK